MNTGFGLEKAVREAREKTGVPGVAAGLLRDGETVFTADGVLELGRSEAVHPETPFRIASITKPFTATLCAASIMIAARASSANGAGRLPKTVIPVSGIAGGAAA